MAGMGLNALWIAGLSFVVTVVILAIGSRIVSGVNNQTNATTDPTAANTLAQGQSAINSLATWLPLIALVVAGVIILGLLVRAFGGLGGGGE